MFYRGLSISVMALIRRGIKIKTIMRVSFEADSNVFFDKTMALKQWSIGRDTKRFLLAIEQAVKLFRRYYPFAWGASGIKMR
jgi:hypothetical protein